MFYFFWNIITFITALSILITVHELGHFLGARLCGVMVKSFSIGFGYPLWKWHDKRGTEYIIASLPFGGYIKMLDEKNDFISPENYKESFNHKNIWQRTFIIAAGPMFNLIFAVFAYWIVFVMGLPGYKPIISSVTANSIASQAGVLPHMKITSVDGIKTDDWDSVRLELINKIGKPETTIGILSLNSELSLFRKLNLHNWKFDLHNQDIITSLGIIPLRPTIDPIVSMVKPGSPAMKAGFKIGDKIIKVNDQPIATWLVFLNNIRNNPEKTLKISIERKIRNKISLINIVLQPDKIITNKGKIEGYAGIMPSITPIPEKYKIFRQYNIISSLIQAKKQTWYIIKFTVNMLKKLVIGSININNISGPISIAQGAGISAKYGLIYYIMFLAVISINLGIINLFPLPVLDGGYLLFLAIEKIKGSPVSEKIHNFSYQISSILLILLIFLAILNDISRL